MTWIDGGEFMMGSLAFYPEEAPLARVKLDGFWIDEAPVTNRQFADFVAATGHVNFAEIAPDPKDYPGFLPGFDRAGSLVFCKSKTPIGTDDPSAWCSFEFGADWCHPLGPDSSHIGFRCVKRRTLTCSEKRNAPAGKKGRRGSLAALSS